MNLNTLEQHTEQRRQDRINMDRVLDVLEQNHPTTVLVHEFELDEIVTMVGGLTTSEV